MPVYTVPCVKGNRERHRCTRGNEVYARDAYLYDKVYSFKNYEEEAAYLLKIARQNCDADEIVWLDVACGTGAHIKYLKKQVSIEGLDRSKSMLEIAREKNIGTKFHRKNMVRFKLGKKYNVITVLYGSIGYVKTLSNLNRTMATMNDHLLQGGLLIVDPWLTPDKWVTGSVHSLLIDEEKFKLARISTSQAEGKVSYFDLHYLIGDVGGTRHIVERHELGLFTRNEMNRSFRSNGFDVDFEEFGLMGRGLYVGKKAGG